MKQLQKHSCIGIWGYGVVGKALARYFYAQGYSVNIMDNRQLSSDEQLSLSSTKSTLFSETDKNNFFIIHDYIFSSPGINIVNDYATHKHKWLHELDIFSLLFNKPIIAITGSIGKTSTTHMLADLLSLAKIKTCVGGNIGTATFDLLSHKDTVDWALLEVSSFQLQHCQTFAPDLAIWTNFFPNHLDHHATDKEYLLAKYMIMAHQKPHQNALIHFNLRNQLPLSTHAMRSYFSAQEPSKNQLNELSSTEKIYFIKNNTIVRFFQKKIVSLIELNKDLLGFSFLENILILAATCDILSINPQLVYSIPHVTQLPEHRLEKILTFNDIDFYNDSKSTTTASTLAAVKKLKNRPLHLFIGGLSKGVNREPFIKELTQNIKYLYCFGKEARQLHTFASQNNIQSHFFDNLESAVMQCLKQIKKGDIVLFSPAGSSYDLYNNYEERGNHFKTLIKEMTH